MAAMVVEQVKEVGGPAPVSMEVEEAEPATPAKLAGSSSEIAASDAAAKSLEVQTPPKESQSQIDRVDEAKDDASGEEDDSNEALGLQLYYLLLRALFKELELYAQPVEAGLLDAKKQLLVYHYAARLHELRSDVVGALHGDLSVTANLPVAFQKVSRKLRKKLQEQGQNERLMELNEKHVFGHDHAIRFVESNLPEGAKEHCVWLREKPHALSDVVKHISPFRDVIKFHCQRNPLMLIEDHGMGLALTIEKTVPVAYLVVSPFLKKPEPLAKSSWKGWREIEEDLSGHLMNFIADDCDGWRTFIQRRANIISKGSLAIIQKALRLKPSTAGLDAEASQKLQDLMDEVEILREQKRKAEEIAGLKFGKESVALEGKLLKQEDKNIDLSIVTEQLQGEKDRLTRDLREKEECQEVLEQRAQTAEQAVEAQREEQETLRRQMKLCDEVTDAAKAARRMAELAEATAKEAEAAMAEQLRDTKGEAELLSGGVHEMMVELKRTEATKRKAIAQAKEVSLQVKTLNIQVKKLQAVEEEAQEAFGKIESLNVEVQKLQVSEKKAVERAEEKEAVAKDAAQAAEQAIEKAAIAEQWRKEAEASLQVKSDALEQIRASNVSLRAEAATAEERVAAMEVAKNEAWEEAGRVKEELKEREDEVKRREDEVKQLMSTFEETKAMVVAAQADVEKERVLTQEAERKAAEATQSEIEMAAKLKINVEQVESLKAACDGMHSEVATHKETAQRESDRALAAEQLLEQKAAAAAQAAVEAAALLEVKERTVGSLMASNVELRTEVFSAKSESEKANAQVVVYEDATNKAKESEAQAQKDLEARLEEIQHLEKSMTEQVALVEAAKEDASAARALKQEAESRKDEACQAEAKTSALLKLKQDEVDHLTSSCGTLSSEIAKMQESLAQESDRAATAEHATKAVSAQLEVTERTIQSMTADNTALRVTLISAKEKADSATELVAAAEKATASARETTKSTRAKLTKKEETIAELEATIAELRAKPEPSEELLSEIARVREDAEESKCQAAEAEKRSKEARQSEADASAKLLLKSEEAAGLVNECAALRGESARAGEQATKAEEHAKEAELAEVNAKAALQYKTDDVERVCAANVELRADILKARGEAEEAAARAEKAEKHEAKAVPAANRARDQAQAELRGKVAAAESMAAALGAIRAEAEAARSAEAKALEVAKRATEEAKNAEPAVKEALKKEGQAMAKLKVKSDEASRLTSECSTLRAETALLREKSEGSTRALKVLAATCEKLTMDLGSSEAKHDWSKLQEPIPQFSSSSKTSDFTLEDMENALTRVEPAEVATEAPATKARRIRSKGKLAEVEQPSSTGAETAAEGHASEKSSKGNALTNAAGAAITSLANAVTYLGSARRLRSKTREPLANKRARVDSGAAPSDLIPDSSEVLDAD